MRGSIAATDTRQPPVIDRQTDLVELRRSESAADALATTPCVHETLANSIEAGGSVEKLAQPVRSPVENIRQSTRLFFLTRSVAHESASSHVNGAAAAYTRPVCPDALQASIPSRSDGPHANCARHTETGLLRHPSQRALSQPMSTIDHRGATVFNEAGMLDGAGLRTDTHCAAERKTGAGFTKEASRWFSARLTNSVQKVMSSRSF